jgi:hypothetical protein
MLRLKNTLPESIQKIQKAHQGGKKNQAANDLKIENLDPFHNAVLEEKSPFKLPKDDPKKTFISGYTGFVPRLQNHFGQVFFDLIKALSKECT